MAGTADTEYTEATRKAIATARSVLSPHAQHPEVKRWLAAAPTDDEPTGREAERALTELHSLSKSEHLPVETRQRVLKASRELQAQVLARKNPRAYDAWRRAQALGV